jgi:hypothetical protein
MPLQSVIGIWTCVLATIFGVIVALHYIPYPD